MARVQSYTHVSLHHATAHCASMFMFTPSVMLFASNPVAHLLRSLHVLTACTPSLLLMCTVPCYCSRLFIAACVKRSTAGDFHSLTHFVLPGDFTFDGFSFGGGGVDILGGSDGITTDIAEYLVDSALGGGWGGAFFSGVPSTLSSLVPAGLQSKLAAIFPAAATSAPASSTGSTIPTGCIVSRACCWLLCYVASSEAGEAGWQLLTVTSI